MIPPPSSLALFPRTNERFKMSASPLPTLVPPPQRARPPLTFRFVSVTRAATRRTRPERQPPPCRTGFRPSRFCWPTRVRFFPIQNLPTQTCLTAVSSPGVGRVDHGLEVRAAPCALGQVLGPAGVLHRARARCDDGRHPDHHAQRRHDRDHASRCPALTSSAVHPLSIGSGQSLLNRTRTILI